MTVEMLIAWHSDFDQFDYKSKENKSCTEERAENMKKSKFPEISSTCCLWKETRIALKQTIPLLIQGEAEARTGVQAGMRRGEARLGVSTGGIFYKY